VLVGKAGSAFTGSGTQHGDQESNILTMIPTLLHHGMIVVGLPYAFQGLSRTDEITGGSPYGASTIRRPDGSRMPSENELAGARFQGRHVVQIAAKLKAQMLPVEHSLAHEEWLPLSASNRSACKSCRRLFQGNQLWCPVSVRLVAWTSRGKAATM
jgi:hypothetical protein